ncbi:helix-turn-helix domain-containing protein [Streptococcus ruminantium]|uniref:helix-turn-helix domain-containing protein n=1 Tax=Streptococcus ruminantium TaxID=1917441 RepID=UPI0012DF87D6|nr:helix-turn-helix transcriptional regulator [Streptococcus ruminantium]
MKWDFGTVLKEIRKSKGLSQREVCGDALSRTTLSKIENNKEYPTIAHFAHILRQLDMTYAEFDYICHTYRPSERSSLINKFENLRGNFFTEKSSQTLLEQIEQYLKKHDDIRLQRMQQQLHLAISISQEGAGERTRCLAQELWQELEKCDTWYLADFRKLNLVLPFLPLKQLEGFVNKVLSSLKKYKDFKEIQTSQFVLLANLSTVLIKNDHIIDCKRIIEIAYQIAQESMRIDYIGFANVRMGILRHDKKMVDKGLAILQAAEMVDMAEKMELEVNEYWGRFA